MNRAPRTVYFRTDAGWTEERVRTVTRPASPWTPRTVITESGRRFRVSDPSIVLTW